MNDAIEPEFPTVLKHKGDRMIGIIHLASCDDQPVGVVIVVGGPQYRIGSHRQFLLLARFLASRGIPAMRFDYRGMGDSEGDAEGFESTGSEVTAAIDEFLNRCPQIRKVVLWGLCDAASTLALHAFEDSRVCALFLVNPWVRSESGLAQTYIKHYYWRRVLSAEFWRKLFSGEMRLIATIRSTFSDAVLALRRNSGVDTGAGLSERMGAGLLRFKGAVRIVLCGQDLTALEFEEKTRNSVVWRDVRDGPLVSVHRLPDANHTFSKQEWRQQVFEWTSEFVDEL